MTANELGSIRQSAVIMTYGPGAIIDFRIPGTGAAVSVVSGGLEQWEEQARLAGAVESNLRRLQDSRLAKKLDVKYFRFPPVTADNRDETDPVAALVGKRFPEWQQCPRCHHLKPASKWGAKPGDPSRWCSGCSENLPGRQKVYVIPVRFVLACRNGHLDDFPWADWVAHQPDCKNKKDFKLISEGAGLAGLVLYCNKCSNKRSLEQIFSIEAHEGRKCTGSRPWLPGNAPESCAHPPRTMQRGASNLYFPAMESALVIPPWSENLIQRLGYEHKVCGFLVSI